MITFHFHVSFLLSLQAREHLRPYFILYILQALRYVGGPNSKFLHDGNGKGK